MIIDATYIATIYDQNVIIPAKFISANVTPV